MSPIWRVSLFLLSTSGAGHTVRPFEPVCKVAERVLHATPVRPDQRLATFPALKFDGTSARTLQFVRGSGALPIAIDEIAKLLQNPRDVARLDLSQYRVARVALQASESRLEKGGVSDTVIYSLSARGLDYPIYLAARNGHLSFIHNLAPFQQWQLFTNRGKLYAFWFDLGPELMKLEWVGERESVSPAIFTTPLCHFPRP